MKIEVKWSISDGKIKGVGVGETGATYVVLIELAEGTNSTYHATIRSDKGQESLPSEVVSDLSTILGLIYKAIQDGEAEVGAFQEKARERYNRLHVDLEAVRAGAAKVESAFMD